MVRRLLVAGGAALLLAAAPAPAPDPLGAARVRGHVEFLADDLLEGRGTGTRGHAIAAAYVAGQFRALGLQPGGDKGGWYQQVPMRRARHAATLPTAALIQGGKRTPLIFGEDIGFAPSLTELRRNFEAELVFVGYGIDDARVGMRDYAAIDARGRIAVALSGTPAGLPADVAAHLGGAKDETAARHGAVGLILIGGDRRSARGEQLGGYRRRSTVDWRDPGAATPRLRVRPALSERWAAALFEGAPRTLAQVRAEVGRAGARPAGFALPARLSIDATSTHEDFSSPEVIGLLPGTESRSRPEYVVLMGHLDHLGLKQDAKPGEDAIYNGALDNAAGVATMIEAAQRFVSSGRRPRRSVLFIANTGEEVGLVGADYFATHPTVPANSIAAVVDLDMPLPLYDFVDVTAFGADHSTVARTVAAAGKSMGIAVVPDPFPQETIFVRSDHYRFVLRGVPAILLATGFGNGGKAVWDHWLPTVYHSVKDDLLQPINWAAAARYAELNYRIAAALANDPQRPRWYAGDYFGDTFAPGAPRAER